MTSSIGNNLTCPQGRETSDITWTLFAAQQVMEQTPDLQWPCAAVGAGTMWTNSIRFAVTQRATNQTSPTNECIPSPHAQELDLSREPAGCRSRYQWVGHEDQLHHSGSTPL
jgi:hypothetical protein